MFGGKREVRLRKRKTNGRAIRTWKPRCLRCGDGLQLLVVSGTRVPGSRTCTSLVVRSSLLQVFGFLPEPARGNSVYSEVKASESSPPKLTPMGDGYALLGPPDEEAALTPRDIHSGYTVLGAPTEPRTVPRKLRPPKQTHVAGGASDPYGDYSKLRISASGPSDPGPSESATNLASASDESLQQMV